MKLGEKVAFCLPTAGRREQLFHLIFTQPGAHLLEIPCICRTHDRPGLFRVLISPGAPRRVQLPTSDLRQGSGNAATSMTFPKWQVQIHKMRFRERWSTAADDIRATTSRLSCATSCREIGSNILHVAHLEFSISEDNR